MVLAVSTQMANPPPSMLGKVIGEVLGKVLGDMLGEVIGDVLEADL